MKEVIEIAQSICKGESVTPAAKLKSAELLLKASIIKFILEDENFNKLNPLDRTRAIVEVLAVMDKNSEQQQSSVHEND